MDPNEQTGTEVQKVHVVTEEKKPLYEIKLNQNDLVEYVTTKEKAKVNGLLSVEGKKQKAIHTQINAFNKKVNEELLAFFRTKEKAFFAIFNKAHEFFLEVKTDFIYSMQNEMTSGSSSNQSRSEYRQNNEHYYDRYNKPKTHIPGKVAIVVVRAGNVVCARVMETPVKLKNQLEKEYKKLIEAEDEVAKTINNLQHTLNQISSNSVQVKNKLVEEQLSKSEEGKQLLGKLNNIKLTGSDTSKLLGK